MSPAATSPTSPKAPRVALYCRVSTTGHGQDVGLQLDELRQVGQQRGWTTTEYVDDGVSGSATSRPALDQMLDAARRGKLDVVCVWKLDRLGRSLQHLLQVIDELTSLGVGFVAVRDAGIDTTTPQGRLLLQLLGAFAEFEKAMIRERVVAGVRRAQSQGKHCGRPEVLLDLRPAVAMLGSGYGLKAISKSLGVSRATLRRRLEEAGAWPRGGSVISGEV
jgi:DNA invertase Pin-like site-specific DNA recombinase